MSTWQPTFDGLAPEAGQGPLESAARATLDALAAHEGLLNGEHALLCALILTTARDIDREPRLTVAKSNMRGLLAELREKLPMPEAEADDKWDAILRDLERLERAGGTATP